MPITTHDLPDALHATEPHASLGAAAGLFDQFVGTWDVAYANLAPDGTVTRRFDGELMFGWILDGRAMQDVWIGYPPASDGQPANRPPERSIGTSIRFYDPSADQWTVVFIAPAFGLLTTVRGGAVGDRIVLHGEGPGGSPERWSFNDIEPDAFTWRGEHSDDQGATWILTDEYHMTRRRP